MVKKKVNKGIDKRFSNLSPDQRMFLKVQEQEQATRQQLSALRDARWEASTPGRISTGLGSAVQGFRQFGSVRGSTQPAPNLTQEQGFLQDIFGGGGGCILGGRDGEALPQMNHTLTARQNGDEGTASLFGFGLESERSGVF